MSRKYATTTAFRAALEERLKNLSKKQGIDLQRMRRQVAFDRLLCRLFKARPGDLFLKGGYSMELRIQKARTTKDIDLVLKSGALGREDSQDQEILNIVQKAARDNLHDFFIFLVGTPTLDLEAVPYGGSRFPVEAHMDGRLFVRFPMDVVVSSLVLDPIEEISGLNWLDFAGIETVAFPSISREQQFAEKLHAYTLPLDAEENSRVKDVIDLILLLRSGTLGTNPLKDAIRKIFEYRGTHPLPVHLEAPPTTWGPKFNKLAKECGIEITLDTAFDECRSFLGKNKIV